MKQAGFDERLTFYGLQAHFFSVDAQVVHWRIAKIHTSQETKLRGWWSRP